MVAKTKAFINDLTSLASSLFFSTICFALLAEENPDSSKTSSAKEEIRPAGQLSILKSFDFQKYNIKIWTIEHNYVDSVRNEIYEIMCKHNYIRILVDISQYDDWYVKKELLEN